MMRIDLAEYLSDGVRADVRAALAAMRGRPVRVRLVNVPAEAFQAAVDRALRVLGPVPFAPMVGGVPCQPGIEAHPVVICVADDDTNITRDAAREIDAWRLEQVVRSCGRCGARGRRNEMSGSVKKRDITRLWRRVSRRQLSVWLSVSPWSRMAMSGRRSVRSERCVMRSRS